MPKVPLLVSEAGRSRAAHCFGSFAAFTMVGRRDRCIRRRLAAARLNVRRGTGAPMAYRVWVVGLLARHDDAEPFLGGDEVVGVIGVLAEVDLYPVDSAGKAAAFAVVVVADG